MNVRGTKIIGLSELSSNAVLSRSIVPTSQSNELRINVAEECMVTRDSEVSKSAMELVSMHGEERIHGSSSEDQRV